MSNVEKAIAKISRLTHVGLLQGYVQYKGIIFYFKYIILFQILNIISKPKKSCVWSLIASSFISMIITFAKFENKLFLAWISCFDNIQWCNQPSGIYYFEIFSRPQENQPAGQFLVKFDLLLFFLISQCWECFVHVASNISISTIFKDKQTLTICTKKAFIKLQNVCDLYT